MNNTYNNKAFLLFLDHWNLLKELTPEEFMRVVQGIFSCAGADCDTPEDMNRMERTVFNAISGDVLRALDNYEETATPAPKPVAKAVTKKLKTPKKQKQILAKLAMLQILWQIWQIWLMIMQLQLLRRRIR